jgi:hypothetical protein
MRKIQAVFAILWLNTALGAWGQNTTGRIVGTITDPTGASHGQAGKRLQNVGASLSGSVTDPGAKPTPINESFRGPARLPDGWSGVEKTLIKRVDIVLRDAYISAVISASKLPAPK